MWLRIMSIKLHKAFSQITYQLCAWHYPWSISSVLDQVPHRSAMQVHMRPPTHTYTTIAVHLQQIYEPLSLSLSFPSLFHWIYLSFSWSTLSFVAKAMAGTRPVKFQPESPFVPGFHNSCKHSQSCLLSPNHCLERHLYQNSGKTSNAYQLEVFGFYLFCICSVLL